MNAETLFRHDICGQRERVQLKLTMLDIVMAVKGKCDIKSCSANSYGFDFVLTKLILICTLLPPQRTITHTKPYAGFESASR